MEGEYILMRILVAKMWRGKWKEEESEVGAGLGTRRNVVGRRVEGHQMGDTLD